MAAEHETEADHHAGTIQRKFLRLLTLLGTISPYVPCTNMRQMLRGPAHYLVSALASDPVNAPITAGFIEVSRTGNIQNK